MFPIFILILISDLRGLETNTLISFKYIFAITCSFVYKLFYQRNISINYLCLLTLWIKKWINWKQYLIIKYIIHPYFLFNETLDESRFYMLLISRTPFVKFLCFSIHYEWVITFYFCFLGIQEAYVFLRMSTA